jgi:hypothetical protein
LAEQWTLNPLVLGSSPRGSTTITREIRPNRPPWPHSGHRIAGEFLTGTVERPADEVRRRLIVRFGKRIRIPTAAVRRMLELDNVHAAGDEPTSGGPGDAA